ncbi:MAG: divalent metal cation transporter [Myxococcales bacterium]|nr:divalent metal cation transporter [Myxococcales bacterium]MCB9583649.1 divalent metal cation transporter [Polyangiaceae bacterium]
MTETSRKGVLSALGPGLLFAAAAVGVSHLVQSTRAGAVYGLALVGMVILANVVKYPAFRFGPYYSVATRTSILEGYRRQGTWALVLYGLLTLGTMFTVLGAIGLVTAGLAMATFGFKASPLGVATALIGVCAVLLAVGHYHWLDRVVKVLVGVLTVSTIVSTVMAIPRVNWAGAHWWLTPSELDRPTIFFVAALVGWMPSAIDVSVWQSLWTLARREDSGHEATLKESSIDFHIGYLGTAFLALCFVLLGAGVMHGSGQKFADTAGGFAAQVITLYSDNLGAWSRPIIGTAAFAVMFSTLLTVVDGFPRALAVLVARFRGPETGARYELGEPAQRRSYWVALLVLSAGALLIISLLMKSLKSLVDIATTLSFLSAPLLSVLNHRAVTGAEVEKKLRPPRWLVNMSLAGIAFQGLFAVYYLWVRYG